MRYRDLRDQLSALQTTKRLTPNIIGGLKFLSIGLFAKVFFADVSGIGVDHALGVPLAQRTALDQVTQVALWSIQIYYDFWAYSTMAIGLGRLFCIELPVNFREPYLSPNPREFWRRWHVTLSYWLRDYVYIPLGGNRAYMRNILIVFALVGTALNKIMPGQSTDLLIDMPPLRAPKAKNVWDKTYHKVIGFMKEIFLFFAAGSVIIVTLQVTGALAWIIHVASPLVVGWLGLPAKAATAFVMGFIRRDFAAAGFFSMNLTNAQLLVSMSTITLFVPCIATAVVVLKERGVAYFVTLFITATTLAFTLGGLLMHGLRLVGLA